MISRQPQGVSGIRNSLRLANILPAPIATSGFKLFF